MKEINIPTLFLMKDGKFTFGASFLDTSFPKDPVQLHIQDV
jgi:hypothetical protein